MARKRQGTIGKPKPEAQGSRALAVAVLSDLHAYVDAEADRAPSHFRVTESPQDIGKNPISALKHLISERGLSAELLLCPGDIGDRANPVAIQYAWRQV